jgi:hypothetical protein
MRPEKMDSTPQRESQSVKYNSFDYFLKKTKTFLFVFKFLTRKNHVEPEQREIFGVQNGTKTVIVLKV